jgi:hypothetical protein
MLLARNVIGEQEDWAQFITLADEHEKPLLAFIPVGRKPVNRLHNYQADVYETPAITNQPDGKDVEAFKSAGATRVELKARVERFDTTAAVSVMADLLGDAAGVPDEMAREIDKQTEIMQRDVECKLGSDAAAFEDNGATQDRMQSIGLWVQSGTTSQVYPTPAAVRPPAASIYSDVKANLTEDALRAVLQSAWLQTGNRGDQFLAVGQSLKERISSFTLFIPSSLSTQSTSLVTNRQMTDKTLQRTVDRYNSEYGNYEIHLSRWLAHPGWAGTTGKAAWRGYGLHANMWTLGWAQKPVWEMLPFQGGGYKAFCYAILCAFCKNPIGETKFDPSDA